MKEIIELPQGKYSVGCNHDVEYKRVVVAPGENETIKKGLYMQILVPRPEDRTKEPEPYPILLYISGGGWKTPQVRYRIPGMARFAERGWLVVMAEYRGREIYRCQDAAEDVRSAIRYTRKHASEYGGNPDQIVLMGDSAGAHLSLLAGYHGDEFDSPMDDLTISAEVSGIIELFGPTDLVGIMQELSLKKSGEPLTVLTRQTLEDLVKTTDSDELTRRLETLSVISRISRETKIPPTLIAQGDADLIVPEWHAEKLYEALVNAGKDVEYYLLKGARHGDKRFYEDDMIDRYEQFIQRCIK